MRGLAPRGQERITPFFSKGFLIGVWYHSRMSRWDSFSEINASSVSGQPDLHAYEAYVKGNVTYVSWVDLSNDGSQTGISAFETGALKLDRKALQKDGGLDAIFACKKLHEEKTDSRLDQGQLVDALDLKLRSATPAAEAAPEPGTKAGWTTVHNVAKI